MFHLLLAVIYLSFISLGLPDGLLGAAWPIMQPQLSVPVSYAGLLSLLISCCTIFSSLASDRLTRKLGTAKLTAVSVAMTALALFGFSFSSSIFELCFWAIPYGLGAGSVDAALNNYVAIHYASRHMSWLHCMWGVGASIGPYIMGFALSGGNNWPMGYRYIGFLQVILTILLFLSLPLWKQQAKTYEHENTQVPALPLHKILMLPGAKEVMITFFCYCALEQTTALWASSYLVLNHGVDAKLAASLGSLFFLGITGGRAVSGFLTMKLNDRQMVRLGMAIIGIGIVLLLLPLPITIAYAGLVLIGLGCAPIYPCTIHATPEHFGAEHSQAIIGVEMASAYVGSCLMPACFGFIANYINIGLFPLYLSIILILMFLMHEQIYRKVTN